MAAPIESQQGAMSEPNPEKQVEVALIERMAQAFMAGQIDGWNLRHWIDLPEEDREAVRAKLRPLLHFVMDERAEVARLMGVVKTLTKDVADLSTGYADLVRAIRAYFREHGQEPELSAVGAWLGVQLGAADELLNRDED